MWPGYSTLVQPAKERHQHHRLSHSLGVSHLLTLCFDEKRSQLLVRYCMLFVLRWILVPFLLFLALVSVLERGTQQLFQQDLGPQLFSLLEPKVSLSCLTCIHHRAWRSPPNVVPSYLQHHCHTVLLVLIQPCRPRQSSAINICSCTSDCCSRTDQSEKLHLLRYIGARVQQHLSRYFTNSFYHQSCQCFATAIWSASCSSHALLLPV